MRFVIRLHVVVHRRVVVADVGLCAALWHCSVLEWRLHVGGILQLSNIANNVNSYKLVCIPLGILNNHVSSHYQKFCSFQIKAIITV